MKPGTESGKTMKDPHSPHSPGKLLRDPEKEHLKMHHHKGAGQPEMPHRINQLHVSHLYIYIVNRIIPVPDMSIG